MIAVFKHSGDLMPFYSLTGVDITLQMLLIQRWFCVHLSLCSMSVRAAAKLSICSFLVLYIENTDNSRIDKNLKFQKSYF